MIFAVVNDASPAQAAAKILKLAGWLSTDRDPQRANGAIGAL